MEHLGKAPLVVGSPSFVHNAPIPSRYSCEGENINPEIQISGIPKKAVTLALIMDDPDAPDGVFDHWLMWNIPVDGIIRENSTPGVQGLNGKGERNYTGPCPPSGTHHYNFKVYALNREISLDANSDKEQLLAAIAPYVISSGSFIGLYSKE